MLLSYPRYSDTRVFAKQKLKAIGFRYGPEVHYRFASDLKAFYALERVVILVGRTKGCCEMTMTSRNLIPASSRSVDISPECRVSSLRLSLERQSKKWKSYQRRRVKQGKRSPDWQVPTVEVAYLKPICETISPYSS